MTDAACRTRRPITEADEARRKLDQARAIRMRLYGLPRLPVAYVIPPHPGTDKTKSKTYKNLYRICYDAPIGPINPWWPTPLVCPKRITVRDVVRRISALYEIQTETIYEQGRERSLVAIRQEIMWISDAVTWGGLSKIGRDLKRDHTTVLHGVKVFAERYGLPRDTHTPLARQLGMHLLERPTVEIVL